MKKKYGIWIALISIALAGFWGTDSNASPAPPADQTIYDGIYAGDIDLSGMTVPEATQAVNAYIDQLANTEITVAVSSYASEEQTLVTTAGDMGIRWANPEVLEEAVGFGKKGNIFKRYKEIRDLARSGQIFEIHVDFDRNAIEQLVTAHSEAVNVPAVNASMRRENGRFVYTDSVSGMEVDIESTVNAIYEKLTQEWDRGPVLLPLQINVVAPEHDAQELEAVQDVLATFTTSYASSGSSRSSNVQNAAGKINGTVLYPGQEFSTLTTLMPFTEDNGYLPAGSYFGGKVVESVGGGVCQISSTLYNAVLYSELEVTNRSNHAMTVGYVDPGLDATISESSGIDFTFKNNTEYPIYIESYTTPDKTITMTIYGVETRPATRSVSYESVIIEKTPPGPEEVYADTGQPAGYVEVQPAHTGYVADVYRVVTENGAEVSREQISHDTYKMTARSATVGVSTNDSAAYELIRRAIASGSVDRAKEAAAKIKAGDY